MRTGTYTVIAFVTAGVLGASSAGNNTVAVQTELLSRLASAPETIDPVVAAFYRDREGLPAWTVGMPAHGRMGDVVDFATAIHSEGLDPRDFRVEDLILLAGRSERHLSPGALATRDILLTSVVFDLGRELAGVRTDPSETYENWSPTTRAADPAASLADAMASGRELMETLASVRPDDPGYARLCDSLARYRSYVEAGGWPELPAGAVLGPGDSGPRVAALRQRLEIEGYVPLTPGDPTGYDDALAVAVGEFQARHGLARDGLVGPNTLAELNVPPQTRVKQIARNLERLRWRARDLGERHIRVNIPAFQLEVVEFGETALSMRVVVGRKDRPTPVLSSRVTYMEVNPYWNIPMKLARKDVLPHIQRDPVYLAERGIRVYESWHPEARELMPSSIDWRGLEPQELGFKLRQEPGPRNALGRVKFMFANPFSVYIHDTPGRGKFAGRKRCYSSGCVRVQDPLTLAAFLLRDKDGERGNAFMAAVDSMENTTLGLPKPVPVHIVYFTAWVDDEGVTHFRDDIYGYDA